MYSITIQVLPRELTCLIANLLDARDAIEFGKSDKQTSNDLSMSDLGYIHFKPVFLNTFLNPETN